MSDGCLLSGCRLSVIGRPPVDIFISLSLKGWRIGHAGRSAGAARHPALLAAAKVGLIADNDWLAAEPQARPRYTLDELLAQCDALLESTAEDRQWLEAKPVGSELL